MRSLIAAIVGRPVTTIMVTVAILVFGLVGATRLPVELLPNLSYPTLTVQTELPDAAPLETEELLTRPIEERLRAVPGVIHIESTSKEGLSEIVLDLAWGTRIDTAMAEVREKLDRVVLPTQALRPLVLRFDPSQEPIMRLALSPPRGEAGSVLQATDLATLRRIADTTVKRSLEKIAGVAAVRLYGGEEREILVELDPDRLAALAVSAEDVVAAIGRDNVNAPGGALTDRKNRFLIRTVHEAKTAADIAAVIVRAQDGARLHVRDLASVRLAPREPEVLSMVEERDAVELAIYREGDANIVAVAQAIRTALEDIPLPPGLELTVLSDRSLFIASAIAEVEENAVVGGMLAVLVLLFFLRDLRATVVIALAIPVSLLAAFVPLQAMQVSLNVMSLGGLALGVGMLVDNSIVVLEAIDRVAGETRDGETSRAEEVIRGTGEVASSVVASTLTTIAVFFPMSFVEGIAGQLVADLSYAVSFSILSSMLVSLTLVPVLQSLASGLGEAPKDPPSRAWLVLVLVWPLARLSRGVGVAIRALGWGASRLAWPLTAAYDAVEATYPRVLRTLLRLRGVVVAVAVVACVLLMPRLTRHGQTLLPELEQGEFFVQVSLPRDASLERTRDAMVAMGRALEGQPGLEARFVRVGSWTVSHSGSGETLGPYLGQLNVRWAADLERRGAAMEAAMLRIREANPEPAAQLQFGQPSVLNVTPALEVLVFSEHLQAAADHARALVGALQQTEGLVDVVPDPLEGRPEVQVAFDPERLSRLGISVEQASQAVQRAVQGEVATTIFAGDEHIDVRVMLPRADRSSLHDVQEIQVTTLEGVSVPLRSVGEVEPGMGASEVRRINGRRGIRIQARSTGVDLGGLAERVQAVLTAHPSPDPEVEAVVSGQAEHVESSLRSLWWTTVLSIFLVYVVMASSFESLWHPFIILLSVPLGIAGVAVACDLTGTPASAMVGIGVIVLGGIVVNNAIVLIHAIADRRQQGLGLNDALVEAGRVRVRPIVMTTLTTVLGLVPMALGLGDAAALRQPLAITIIGGLSFSTVLTLFVIPCIYRIVPGRTPRKVLP